MNKLCNWIELYRKGDKEVLVDIVKLFKPLLKKFERNSYCEDIESELILFIITLLEKMPEGQTFKDDKYAFSYIYKSLKNKYIYINRKGYTIYNHEVSNDIALNQQGYYETFSDIVFNDMIEGLTTSEKNIMYKKYIYNLSNADIARELNVSRQAVYKIHKRALDKLKNINSNLNIN